MKTTYEMRDEREVTFKTKLMPAIAKAMNGTISGNPEAKWCESVTLPNAGHALYFRLDSGKNMVEISGHYPKSRLGDYAEFTPRNYCPTELRELPLSICVSAEKSAEQIVKDINRRLMPNYVKVFAACGVARDAHEVYIRVVSEMSHKLASVLGTSCYSSGSKAIVDRVKLPNGLAYGPVEVRREGVTFRLDLNHEQAMKLAEFLRTL